jgi:RNA polymerase I-specific transcription initiation factor RRN3
VVLQFARVAQAVGFVYVYPLLDANRRFEFAAGTRAGVVVFGDSALGELTSFFPFDPYRLPRSSMYIEGVYREWASVAVGDEEEEEDEHEVEEAEELKMGAGARPIADGALERVQDTDGLGASFGGMSISPAQPAGLASMSVSTSVLV